MKYLKDRNSILSLLYHTGFYPTSGKNRAFSLDKTGRVSSMYNSESSQWLMPNTDFNDQIYFVLPLYRQHNLNISPVFVPFGYELLSQK